MLFTSVSPPAACGTGGSLNVLQWARTTSSVLLPAAPRAVANPACGSLLQTSTHVDMTPRIDVISRELIDWGTCIGFSRAVQQAEGVLPGISLPWAAYQAFSALSAARRGHLAVALQRLPFTSLAPAALLDAIGACLARWLPDTITQAPDHDDLVLGLAACAFLHVLTCERSGQRSRIEAGRTLQVGIRRLRAGLNLLAAVRRIGNRVPAAAGSVSDGIGEPRLQNDAAAPTRHLDRTDDVPRAAEQVAASCMRYPAPPANATQWERPSWPGVDTGAKHEHAASGDAWPLPGASARKTRVKPKPPRLGVQAPAGRPSAGAPAARGQPGQGRRAPSRNPGAADGTDAFDPAGASTIKKQSAVHQMAQQAKESTAVAKQAAGKGALAAHPARGEDERKAQATEATTRRTPAAPSSANVSDLLSSAPPGETPVDTLSCLRFHDTAEARLQVRKMRFLPRQTPFCVPRLAHAHFMDVFASAPAVRDTAATWMKTHTVRETVSAGQRDAGVIKYFGLGQIQRAEARDATALADDDLFAVLSVSVLSDDQLRRQRVPSEHVIARNGFRLLLHRGPDGAQKHFIAFFINPGDAPCRGARAGFLEVTTPSGGGHAVRDEVSGFGLVGGTLAALVEGVQKMSGCVFAPAPLPQGPASDAQDDDPGVMQARHLFVREQSTWCGGEDYTPQMLTEDPPLFIAKTFHLPGHAESTILYRQSFLLVTDALMHMDERGHVGTLRLQASTSLPGRVLLGSPQRAVTRRLMDLHGLQEGDQVQIADLIERLEHGGLSWIRNDMAAQCRQQREDDHPAPSIVCSLSPPVTDPASVTPSLPRRSWFDWEGDQIRYVDHDGTVGTLTFQRTGDHGRNLMLASANDADAVTFARRNGVQPWTRYAEDEILWLLKGEGFVRVTEEHGGVDDPVDP